MHMMTVNLSSVVNLLHVCRTTNPCTDRYAGAKDSHTRKLRARNEMIRTRTIS